MTALVLSTISPNTAQFKHQMMNLNSFLIFAPFDTLLLCLVPYLLFWLEKEDGSKKEDKLNPLLLVINGTGKHCKWSHSLFIQDEYAPLADPSIIYP